MRALYMLPLVILACEGPPPVKNAHGERIKSVEILEEFASNTDPREASFRGESLQHAVAAMDKRGVWEVSGTFEAKGVIHESTFTLVVRTIDDKERRIVMKDCAEPHVCGFLDDLAAKGRFERKPVACRSSNACAR
jgi:hypothetical protein